VNIELHRNLESALIAKSGMSKKVLYILPLGDIEGIRGRGNLNAKKVAKRTKICHEKLLTKMGLYKGNALRVVISDNYVINVEQKVSPPMRRCVHKESMVMCARVKANISNHRGKTLKHQA
jgi:hypothetical protein